MEPVSANNSRFRLSEGDWICSDPQCGNVNFARRDTCNRCDKEKIDSPKKKKLGQEIGKAAAEKSRGLFSADDWQCNKCGNVNWARRQSCNMCNAPKYGEVEERTGYGGGYNDRGVVEYIERQDSDDDYDEFGRRKKKKSSSEGSSDKTSQTVRGGGGGGGEEEEEEEDEDEEDDGDLSKYDLSGWGDEDEEEIGDRDKKDFKKDAEEKDKIKDRDRNGRIREKRPRTGSRSRSRSSSHSRRDKNHYSQSRGSSSNKSLSKSPSSSPSSGSSRRYNNRSR